jgi:RNA polymerase sigma-70 factor, ECF subfamily
MDDKMTALSSLEALVEAVAQGSQPALRRLYDQESRRLYGIALRIARRPALAADALQDAFVQIWQKAGSFSAERGTAEAWLTAIVRYRTLDAMRKVAREEPTDDPALGDRAEGPQQIEQIDRLLSRDALQRCLGQLDDNQRRSIVLAFVDGLSHAEIAERLPAPLGSVKSWVRRGLLSLRSCLDS